MFISKPRVISHECRAFKNLNLQLAPSEEYSADTRVYCHGGS